MIKDNELLNFQRAIAKKMIAYRKRGYGQEEAFSKVINKCMIKQQQIQLFQQYSTKSDLVPYDPEMFSKIKKIAGLSYDEFMKSLQLKRQIDNMINFSVD